ncbi:hypothetical protein UNDYM_3687 [Undibacterium sp. YM2]|uniref:M23 family metallopeptidase n=1 Tax=Undibacterium sp. YM2 TaxID=2058625 RepID=UPI001331CB7F|nr:M23 family metallopeptidase [Undibacterium sp. YM2]BBB67940.1 hypothetical protein UNDYM_3687 [Undibacterium sp. YM2]
MTAPIIIEFPLSGEWLVGADGTEAGHERALDLIQVDHKFKATRRPLWRELFQAVPLGDYYAFGQPIFSPFAGRVVTAVDGCPEAANSYLRTLVEMLFSKQGDAELQQLMDAGHGDIRAFAGNHIILQSSADPAVHAFLAHARTGSVCVEVGQEVAALQTIAAVGNSGQSMTPHLHFHLMAGANPVNAVTLECCFRAYELFSAGQWQRCETSLPRRRQRIRALAA